MQKITFIYPAIGKKPGVKYIKTWKMEPLPIATLAALTPGDINVEFFDDRMELIDYNTNTDLVGITLETYTARRSYNIAKKFRDRGIPVVMGGYHATHLPNEVLNYADSVVVGNAEGIWPQVVQDAKEGKLKKIYSGGTQYGAVLPDRSIFDGKKYLKLGLVETGRGCPFTCEFCQITTYYKGKYYPRPIKDVIADIVNSGKKYFFFVDDNFVANPKYAIELCKELAKLNISWSGQGTLTMAKNKELLKWLRKSGCCLLLTGFESLDEENLKQMNKQWSSKLGERDELVQRIHDAGISMYATFIFGFDHDSPDTFKQATEFALKHDFFYAAFNHLLPFPGTPLFERLEKDNRLLRPKWWLDNDYNYGDIAFQPTKMSPQELSDRCVQARKDFFKFSSLPKRAMSLLKRNASPTLFPIFMFSNLNLQEEVEGKLGLPVGDGLDEFPK